MGGNLVLKMAGEMADSAPAELRGVIAVCPAANLAACADALNERQNIIYQRHFVRSLKKHTRFKAALFPERYPLNGLDGVRTVREFDDAITAKFCGYRDADDYYYRASALRVADAIRVPTIIISAQDDPIVPIQTLRAENLTSNRYIAIVTPRYGGAGGGSFCAAGAERIFGGT